jgi:acetyl-CoA carboxylase/biotin carboxylase 1
VYDFLGLMEKSLIQRWEAYVAERPSLSRPADLFEASELGLDAAGALEPIKRTVGTNTIGMVAWQCTMRTPEAPNGRDVVRAFLLQPTRPFLLQPTRLAA